MYLLMGSELNPCYQMIGAALAARGLEWRIIEGPFKDPVRLSWYLDNDRCVSRLVLDDGAIITDADISGVMVENILWMNPEGWQPEDLAYVHTETQAAILGWLWSLRCPVVGRLAADLWYRPQVPMAFWQPLLSRCGLLTPEVLVSNVEHESRAFGERLKEGVVYAPFTSPARYLVEGEADWSGIATMQSYSPVCIAQPHGAAQAVCVAGERIVWEGEPPPESAHLEPGLRRFARDAGLNFVELAVARTSTGMSVVAVEPLPFFGRFGETARRAIVEALIEVLTAGGGAGRSSAATHIRQGA
jgi:hypothetical protein